MRDGDPVVPVPDTAADGKASQEELRFLELLRHRLEVGRLPAAAIERAARARHQTL